jgi:pyruvate/2-oxoglutarate dehydrogenase complex dihydrolipoamide acyltransferase (E2) component
VKLQTAARRESQEDSMKRALLLMVVSALLVTLGFAQTPAAGSNTDPANVKGCLGGSDGNYTVVEDGSRQLFKISTSSVDLKPHVGHDVKLVGHKASGAVSSGSADNSFAVTELSMISEHCTAAAAATVGAVVPYSQTVIEPTAATPAPSAPASTPAVDAAAPAATPSPSAAPVSTPAAEATAPAATASPSAAVSAPTVKADHSARRRAAPRKLSAKQATTAAAPAATVSPTAADAPTTVSPSPETVSPAAADAATASPSATPVTPDAAATTPAVTHRTGSLSLLIAFVVLVVVLGTLAPLLGRWRKRKMLERTGSPNLSFTNETSTIEVGAKEATSELDKPQPRKVA